MLVSNTIKFSAVLCGCGPIAEQMMGSLDLAQESNGTSWR